MLDSFRTTLCELVKSVTCCIHNQVGVVDMVNSILGSGQKPDGFNLRTQSGISFLSWNLISGD